MCFLYQLFQWVVKTIAISCFYSLLHFYRQNHQAAVLPAQKPGLSIKKAAPGAAFLLCG